MLKTSFKILLPLMLSFSAVLASAGEVCTEDSEQAALLVIDMQAYFVKRAGGQALSPENAEKLRQVVAQQKAAIAQARQAQIPIVFVTYQGYGETISDLRAAVAGYGKTKHFLKNTDGMFDRSSSLYKDIKAYFKDKKIGRLLVTGANGGACVKKTIFGALDGECDVVAYDKGIADFNYEEFIYPYSERIEPILDCKTCTFKEVANIGAFAALMTNDATPPTTTRTGTVNKKVKGTR